MDAHKLWMLRDFIGTNKVLFRIPVYQRNYDWSESNCNRLLDDIYGIMQSSDKHSLIIMLCPAYGFLNPSVNVYTLLLTELVDFKPLIFNSLFVAADSYVL